MFHFHPLPGHHKLTWFYLLLVWFTADNTEHYHSPKILCTSFQSPKVHSTAPYFTQKTDVTSMNTPTSFSSPAQRSAFTNSYHLRSCLGETRGPVPFPGQPIPPDSFLLKLCRHLFSYVMFFLCSSFYNRQQPKLINIDSMCLLSIVLKSCVVRKEDHPEEELKQTTTHLCTSAGRPQPCSPGSQYTLSYT